MLTATKGPNRQITGYSKADKGVVFTSEYGELRLIPISESIVRVTCSVSGELDAGAHPGIVCTDLYKDYSISESEDSFCVATDKLICRVSKEDGAITFIRNSDSYDSSKDILYSECARIPYTFEKFPTYTLSGNGASTEVIHTPDGDKTVIKEAEREFTGDSYHITWYTNFGDEALNGLGQHEEGYGNLRGKTIYVHQANRKIAIPMLVSSKGYGFLVDSYSPMIFNDSADEPYYYIEASKELDYYFIFGENPKGVVAGYRKLTGKASMLPKWAFGFVQSEERYEDANQLIDTVEKCRQNDIGIDCIVEDWISWPDNQWGQKSFDHTRFPNPKEMIDTLHDKHAHFMISVWPTASQGCADHDEFAAEGVFLKASNVYNALSPKGREVYWRQLSREHWASGVDAWWCDSSEPITPEWNLRNRPEPSALYHEYLKEMGLRLPYEMSNSFCLFHAQGIYEGQRRQMEIDAASMNSAKASGADDAIGDAASAKAQDAYKEKRVVNLTRSAYTGQQRYGTIMWSGDIEAKWSTYKKQLGAGLNFCASGLPYWTVDVGAFFVCPGDFWYWNGDYEKGNEDLGYRELYTRWYQWAAFLPVFRCHGTDCHRELWHYGKKGEMFYDALLAANHLRYELMPYIYSEAGKVWLNDASIIEPLTYSYPNDKNVWNITDQYMFGESLMVCPVTEPMYYGVGSTPLCEQDNADNRFTRKVYLPEGDDWIDYRTNRKYAGGQWIETLATIDVIPVFVKNGSAIPTTDFALSTEEQTGEIKFRIFSDKPCEYTMYTDAGDGYAYERGEYTLKTYKFDENGKA